MKSLLTQWKRQLQERSGNLTTNEEMPDELISKLLEEDESLADDFSTEEITCPALGGLLGDIKGLEIIANLQNLTKQENLTVFRAVRFPTNKRIHEVLHNTGYALGNHEQERILHLYTQDTYTRKREEIMNNAAFWTQPQERVVRGLPVFCLVNDALQIHRAYRGKTDQVLIVAIHIPHELLENGKITLISNPAIDLDHTNEERDYEIKDFTKENGVWGIDYAALRARGIDLHEMYTEDLPWSIAGAEKLGITQDFFLLDIYKITDTQTLETLRSNTELLKKNSKFLHGLFGDQNIFGRRKSEYLPSHCKRIKKK